MHNWYQQHCGLIKLYDFMSVTFYIFINYLCEDATTKGWRLSSYLRRKSNPIMMDAFCLCPANLKKSSK